MSRTITPNSSSSAPVAAGSTVISQVNTTTGFTAGDYVYTTPTGVGTRTTGNVFVGVDSPYVGTTFLSTGLQSSTFREASYGPLVDQAVFTGSTRTLSNVIVAASTVVSTASSYNRSCTLANGNIVQMYSQLANLYFRVIDTTGAVVVAQITLTTALATSSLTGNFACCTLVSGNIQFIYNVGTSLSVTTAQYSAAGAVVVAATARAITTVTNYANISMTALSGGGSIAVGGNGYTADIATPRGLNFDSTGALVSQGNLNSSGSQRYLPIVGLPASYGTNIWAVFYQNITTGSGALYCNIYTNLSSVANVPNTASGRTCTLNAEGTFNPTFTTDGYIVGIQYSSGSYPNKFLYTKTSETAGTLTFVSDAALTTTLASGTLSPLSNGGVSFVGVTSAGAVFISTATSSGTALTFGAAVQVLSSIASNIAYIGAFSSASANGVAVINYNAVTTNYNTSIIAATIPATNGAFLAGNSYLPSNGYYLMGVAATTAGANATGQVITNGPAQLGSLYPSVTTTLYYSYQTTAGQPIFGQRGSVISTIATLKGLE